MLVPRDGDSRAVTLTEVAGNPGYTYTDPERTLGADDALVRDLDLHEGSGTMGQSVQWWQAGKTPRQ